MIKCCHCTMVVVAAVFGLLTTRAPAATVNLVEDGRPRATIVLAEEPRAAAQLAAYELQHYLERMSGARIPIVREPADVSGNRILIGESIATNALGYDNSGFDRQEYLIKTMPDTLVLIGHDHDGFTEVDYESYASIYHALPSSLATCYAVHAFLENNLGVRWYYPNEEIGEIVPSRPTVVVKDLNIRRKPDAATLFNQLRIGRHHPIGCLNNSQFHVRIN